MIALFARAGVWQLDRAEETRALLGAFDRGADTTPIAGVPGDEAVEMARYRSITLSGRYLPERQVLLDSIVHDGTAGYQVLTPFDADGIVVLVNRGWVDDGGDRSMLPAVDVGDSHRTINGRIDRLPVAGLSLPDYGPASTVWPRRMLYPSAAEVAAALDLPVRSYQILLSAEEPDGYLREWRPSWMRPDRHVGYAVQWFALAAAVILAWLVLEYRRRRGMMR